MPPKKARLAPAGSDAGSSRDAAQRLYAREPDGARQLAQHFVSLVQDHMRGGADREQLSIGLAGLGLHETHVETLENVGVIKRNDDTFLAELGETFVVPTNERDKCARWSQAVRELEGRIEAVWPAAAVPVAAGERPARRVEQMSLHAAADRVEDDKTVPMTEAEGGEGAAGSSGAASSSAVRRPPLGPLASPTTDEVQSVGATSESSGIDPVFEGVRTMLLARTPPLSKALVPKYERIKALLADDDFTCIGEMQQYDTLRDILSSDNTNAEKLGVLKFLYLESDKFIVHVPSPFTTPLELATETLAGTEGLDELTDRMRALLAMPRAASPAPV